MFEFSFGSDPEFMLKSPQGRYCSAVEIVPGNREERHQVGDHEYYYDNVLAECAIKPGNNKRETTKHFRECFRQYAKLVKPHHLVVQAAQKYPLSELQTRAAVESGCTKESCAYTMEEIEKDYDCVFIGNCLRTAGGHIHLGASIIQKDNRKPNNFYNRLFAVRMLDLFLAIPAIYMDQDKTAKKRKDLYGQAGRYREPPYGIEYRTLSNFWLSSPHLVGLIYDVCKFTLEFISEKKHWEFWTVDFDRLNDMSAWEEEDFDVADCHQCHGYDLKSLRLAVDNMDKKRAGKFLKLIEELMPTELHDSVMDACEPRNDDFYTGWKL